MWTYSLIWMNRNVRPSRNVATMPSCRPSRLFFLIDSCAKWIVKLEEIRIAVLKPAISFGSMLARGPATRRRPRPG